MCVCICMGFFKIKNMLFINVQSSLKIIPFFFVRLFKTRDRI